MRSLEPAYAWSMSTTFHTQRVLTARLSKFRRCISFTKMPVDISIIVPVFQKVQEIVEVPKSQRVDRIFFDVKAMLKLQVPTSHMVQWTVEAVSPRSYVSACFFVARSPYLLFQNNLSRCCSSRVAKPSTTYRSSSEAVEDQQVQFSYCGGSHVRYVFKDVFGSSMSSSFLHSHSHTACLHRIPLDSFFTLRREAAQDLGWLHLDSTTKIMIEYSKALALGICGKLEPSV